MRSFIAVCREMRMRYPLFRYWRKRCKRAEIRYWLPDDKYPIYFTGH